MQEIVLRIVIEAPKGNSKATRTARIKKAKKSTLSSKIKPSAYRVLSVPQAAKVLGRSTQALYYQARGENAKDPRIVRFEHHPRNEGRGWAATKPMIAVVLRDDAD